MEFKMIFIIGWVVLGLIGQALYMWGMHRRYSDIRWFDLDTFLVELIICIIAGPVTFLVLGVVFGNPDDEEDDE